MKYTTANTVDVGLIAFTTLDGQPVDYAIEADTDEGYVIVIELESDGTPKLKDDLELATKKLYGKVEVRILRSA